MKVEFIVRGVRNANGLVRGLAFGGENEGFPEDQTKAIAQAYVRAEQGEVRLIFDEVPGLQAAFSFFHDEKGIGRIEKNFLGIPKSGVTASRWNGKGRPKFRSCLVPLDQKHLVSLKYF